jgi:hypothetical protein
MKSRPIRIEGNVAYVPLTRGYEAIIDAGDVHLVDGCNWCARLRLNTVYVQRTDCSGAKKRTVQLHRVLLSAPDEMQVDHINGDGLDNRRSNLRLATPSQNMYNQRPTSKNTSGFKGVSWENRHGKWRAQIAYKGNQRHLGYYSISEAAYQAYVDASSSLHGEFSRIA